MISPTRFQLLCWLKRHGKEVKGNILHAGSGVDYCDYKQFFPKHNSFLNLDIRQQENVDIIADIQNMLCIPAESQDCVLTVFVLYQLPNVEDALNEVHRVLKPEGIIFTTFPSTGWPLGSNDFDRRFTLEEIEGLMNNFEIEEVFEVLNHKKEVTEFLVRGKKIEE